MTNPKVLLKIGRVIHLADGGAILEGDGVLSCAALKLDAEWAKANQPTAGAYVEIDENDGGLRVIDFAAAVPIEQGEA